MMKKFFVVLTGVFLTLHVCAQETLSLEQAIALGLKSNFDIQIEKLNQEIATNNNNWGQAGRYPTVSLNLNQNNSVVQRKPANPFAVAGRNVSDNVTGQLDIAFVLFDGFAIKLTKARLDQVERLSNGNATFVIESTIQSIILGYFQALLEKERLQVLKRNLTFSKERYEWVKLRKELGGAISFDVLREETNYLTDSSNVLLQQINLKTALRNLNVLLNENLTTQYVLTDSLDFNVESYEYETLRQRMVSSNTNLHNQFINQEILRINTKILQADRYPSLLLNVGANGSLDQLNALFRSNTGNQVQNTVGYLNGDPGQPVYNVVDETAQIVQTQRGNSYGAYGNLGLRWTLFNGGQIKRSIENAKIQEKIGQLTTDQLKLSLENDLIGYYDLYQLRIQLISMAQARLRAAELNLDLANERYHNGSISAIDLRIIQESNLTAALENFDAIYAALQVKTELTRLIGGFVGEYVTPTD